MSVINKVAIVQERRIKLSGIIPWGNCHNNYHSKLFTKLRQLALHINRDVYRAARYKIQKMIRNENKRLWKMS